MIKIGLINLLQLTLILYLSVTSNAERMRSQAFHEQTLQASVGITNKTLLIWPLPSNFSADETSQQSQVNPCTINYIYDTVSPARIQYIVEFYRTTVFKCDKIQPGPITLTISVRNPNQLVPYITDHQKYSLTIRTSQKWDLIADYHAGFVRGFQTFTQLFQKINGKFIIKGRPILIDDKPDYLWRGLMIDSSRHFLSVNAVKHQIDALMYNKMNILHWHIVDEDSFTMQIPQRPELAQYGNFSNQTYSVQQMKDIYNYGQIRGIRVILQFDTPAHTQAWGRSDLLKDIVVKCNSQYSGQFDPTLDLTYDTTVSVMKLVSSIFVDNYTHFGGDEISYSCYNNKPSIKQWMDKNGIADYGQLSVYYRKRQKALWRNITKTSKAIYWANAQLNLPVQDDDVIHWWGDDNQTAVLAGKKNQVILSNQNQLYIDHGFGGRRGDDFRVWLHWRDIYKFQPRIPNVNVIGGQTTMWAEVCNQQVLDQKVWPRTSALNQRLWNVKINGDSDILNIASRLIAHTKRMKQRGIKASPATVGLCQQDPSVCFG